MSALREKTTFEMAPVILDWAARRSGAAMTISGSGIDGGALTVTNVDLIDVSAEPYPVIVARRRGAVIAILGTGGAR